MTVEEFDAWLPVAIAGYAEEHVASGRWSKKEALERSRKEHETLLPDGIRSPRHHLWTLRRKAGGERVGLLWMAVVEDAPRHAFVYNLEIDPDFRRRGYAEQAMRKLEEEVRRLGLDTIRLHVFGHNAAARPVYEKLGYEPTNIIMAKRLE